MIQYVYELGLYLVTKLPVNTEGISHVPRFIDRKKYHVMNLSSQCPMTWVYDYYFSVVNEE